MHSFIPSARTLSALIALFFLSAAPGSLRAQVATNGLSVIRVILPDTSFLGASDSAFVTVKNTANNTYQGYLNFYYTTDTVVFSPLPLCNTPAVMLAVNDTFQIRCGIVFDSTYWNTGGNIVVVWSSGSAIAPADSMWDKVFLKTLSPTLSVHTVPAAGEFSIYPTLAFDHIFIETSGNVVPARILIEDVSGRVLQAIVPSAGKEGIIRADVSSLSRGIYFLDCVMPDRQRCISRFVKAE